MKFLKKNHPSILFLSGFQMCVHSGGSKDIVLHEACKDSKIGHLNSRPPFTSGHLSRQEVKTPFTILQSWVILIQFFCGLVLKQPSLTWRMF